VQGVFYRHNAAKKAKQLGLRGFVRNLPDSRVEVLVEGDKNKVYELLYFCKDNPGYSKVKGVELKEEKEIKEAGFIDFEIGW